VTVGPDQRHQAFQILAAGVADAQVRGDARETAFRGRAAGHGQLGVDVHDRHGAPAADVGRVGPQETLKG
jgi:hypothetical protein